MASLLVPILACLFIIAVCGCGDSGKQEEVSAQFKSAEFVLEQMDIEFQAMLENREPPDSLHEIDQEQLIGQLQWNDELYQQFLEFAKNGTDRQRIDATWVLGRSRRPEGLSVIIENTKDEDGFVYMAGLRSLNVYVNKELTEEERELIVTRLIEIVDVDPTTLNDAEAKRNDNHRTEIMGALQVARRARFTELEPYARRHYEAGVFNDSEQKSIARLLEELAEER